ncbi:hypothetical protein [Nocardia salmonicida]|uniref:hypothetical protein n=1 Tax=Nocardia salmonicida TaxID=53431 RepID=UPI002E2C0E0F|nr:hypothetical protein [Nocardia salmonicida]
MHPESSPDPIVQQARDLARRHRGAMVAAENPDLAYPDWDGPLPNLDQQVLDAETAFYEHMREHRKHLGGLDEFRSDYRFLGWLASENADLRDYQTWTNDPEQPLRRADRRRSR